MTKEKSPSFLSSLEGIGGAFVIPDRREGEMPLYVYEVVLQDGTGGEQFEVLQKMSDAPLTEHPETGEPVRRVFAEPNAPRAWADSVGKSKLTDKNLAAKGFTKYVKTDKGTYEKTAGDGPKKLKKK
jgi:hypothetical protein